MLGGLSPCVLAFYIWSLLESASLSRSFGSANEEQRDQTKIVECYQYLWLKSLVPQPNTLIEGDINRSTCDYTFEPTLMSHGWPPESAGFLKLQPLLPLKWEDMSSSYRIQICEKILIDPRFSNTIWNNHVNHGGLTFSWVLWLMVESLPHQRISLQFCHVDWQCFAVSGYLHSTIKTTEISVCWGFHLHGTSAFSRLHHFWSFGKGQ